MKVAELVEQSQWDIVRHEHREPLQAVRVFDKQIRRIFTQNALFFQKFEQLLNQFPSDILVAAFPSTYDQDFDYDQGTPDLVSKDPNAFEEIKLKTPMFFDGDTREPYDDVYEMWYIRKSKPQLVEKIRTMYARYLANEKMLKNLALQRAELQAKIRADAWDKSKQMKDVGIVESDDDTWDHRHYYDDNKNLYKKYNAYKQQLEKRFIYLQHKILQIEKDHPNEIIVMSGSSTPPKVNTLSTVKWYIYLKVQRRIDQPYTDRFSVWVRTDASARLCGIISSIVDEMDKVHDKWRATGKKIHEIMPF